MFRMLRLKPPNGWHAVGWELLIVTLGVLVALGRSRWRNGRVTREWRSKPATPHRGNQPEFAWHQLARDCRAMHPASPRRTSHHGRRSEQDRDLRDTPVGGANPFARGAAPALRSSDRCRQLRAPQPRGAISTGHRGRQPEAVPAASGRRESRLAHAADASGWRRFFCHRPTGRRFVSRCNGRRRSIMPRAC